MSKRIRGVMAAVPTPFDEQGRAVASQFLDHCEWLIAQGADGLNVLGSTGEANSQSMRSRMQVMQIASDASLGDARLMVGTGTPSLHETVELTTHAAELGFDAALILPPYYYAPVSDDGLFEFFSRVIEPVSKSDMGIYLYNFPQMTGLKFSTELVERLLQAYPDHMRGMKDSSGDLDYTNSMAASFSGRFDVFPGSEGPLANATKYGYAGCISASVNATVAEAVNVWRKGDGVTAEEVDRLQSLRNDIASVPIVAAVKALVAMRTGDTSWRRMLPPLMPLSGDKQIHIESVAERLGLR